MTGVIWGCEVCDGAVGVYALFKFFAAFTLLLGVIAVAYYVTDRIRGRRRKPSGPDVGLAIVDPVDTHAAEAILHPDDRPIMPRPQPDISSAAQRYGAEVEAYLKEHCS